MIFKSSTLPDLKVQAAFCDELRAGKSFVQAAAATGFTPQVFAFLAMNNASFAGDVNTELRRFGTDVVGPDGWLRLIESKSDDHHEDAAA